MLLVFLAAAFSVAVPNASLRPVTVSCIADPEFAAVWGIMSVTVDEQARHVHLEADWTSPGAREDYWDGAVGRVSTGRPYPWLPDEIVEQFVRFTPTTVEVGWHDLNGEFQHYASFARAAFRNKRIPCRWHVYWPLGQG